jgi:UDP:flavonoid glycosyltransferase YjiC (YdhE family)
MRALSAGVPILAMPMGRDQNDNAARIVWHGSGLRIDPASQAEVIAGAIDILTSTPSFSEAAQSLGAKVRAQTEPDRAVRLLEQLATDSQSASRTARAGAADVAA